MRYLLSFCLIGVLPAMGLAQEKKGKDKEEKEVDPVKVVELKRDDPVKYEKEIQPIFKARCIACHAGAEKKSRFDITSYDALIKGGKRGAALVPGKADQSLLYKVMGRTVKPHMPPLPDEELEPGKKDDPVTPQELALVKLWIDQGAKAPTGPSDRPPIVVGLPPANVTPVRALAVSPDKSTVVAGRGNQLHVYDAGSGAFIRSLVDPNLKMNEKPVKAAHLSLVSAMAFSPDGKWLVSGSFQEIAVWDFTTGQLRHKITGFAHEVVSAAFSSDSKLFAVGGGAPTEDGEIKVFQIAGKEWKLITDIKGGHSDTVYGLCFSPVDMKLESPKKEGDKKDEKAEGKTGTFLATCSADKFIKVWTIPDGKFVKSLEGHTHHVLDVGWRADGKLLASAGADNTVKVWDYEKGEQARTIAAHTKQVTRLIFVGKTAQIATCGGDAQVKFFNVDNGGNVRNFGGSNDFVYAVAVSPDGNVVAAGGQEGVVRVYNGANGQLTRTLLPPGVQGPGLEKK